jgi:membrane protein DedA with SNARE-associated domain
MRRALLILLVAALIPLVPFLVIGELPGERWLMAAGDDAWRFGAVGCGLLALDVLMPIPSSLVGALLGGRLGFLPGLGWAVLGLGAGNALGYLLGRLVPARFASELPSMPSQALVFLSRPVPVLAEAVAIAAGAERMSVARFALSAGAGNAIYAAAMAADGAMLLPSGLAGPGLIVPMAVPVVAWTTWWLLRRRGDRMR